MQAKQNPNTIALNTKRPRFVFSLAMFGLAAACSDPTALAQCSPSVLNVRQTVMSPLTGAYAINGVSRQALVLVEGQTYTFNFPSTAGSGSSWPVPSVHPWVLTTDPDGGGACCGQAQLTATLLPGYTFGSHCATSCAAAGGNTFTCTPGPLTPSLFYYQCTTHMNLGASVTILRLPVITAQPVAVATCAGGEASFSVGATLSEGSLSYQWRRNGVPLGTPESLGPVLTISPVESDDLGAYDCVVSNSCAQVITNAVPLATCPADLSNGSGQPVCDGGVDINDLLFFLAGFESGSTVVDLDNGSGDGVPDGGVDINDLLFFLTHFEAGC